MSPFTSEITVTHIVERLKGQANIKILNQNECAMDITGTEIVNIEIFHYKFIAYVPSDEADVDILMTSSNFNSCDMKADADSKTLD